MDSWSWRRDADLEVAGRCGGGCRLAGHACMWLGRGRAPMCASPSAARAWTALNPPMHVRSRSAPHTLSAREGRLTLHLHALESSSCTPGLIKEGEMLMATQSRRGTTRPRQIFIYILYVLHIYSGSRQPNGPGIQLGNSTDGRRQRFSSWKQ